MFLWSDKTKTDRMSPMFYETLVKSAQTGDLLLFEGEAWYSRLIEFFGYSRYSHIGMILRDPTYLNKDLNGLYLLQSSIVPAPDSAEGGDTHFGVQIVPLDQAVTKYKQSCGTMYYRSLDCVRDQQFTDRLKNAYKTIQGKPYDLNPCDWIKAEFGIHCGNLQRTDEFWCSSLVAFMYVRLGFLYPSIPWSIIAPRRFSAFENLQLNFQDCNITDEVEIDFSQAPPRRQLKKREYFIGK